jgi:hypothetical protein
LATAVGRAALRCGRGRGSYSPGDENLQQPELDEPLVNPRRKKEGRRRLSFTGGDEDTAAAKNRAAMESEGARARVVVCCGCKEGRRSSSTSLNRSIEREAGGPRAAALAIDGRDHHGSVLKEGSRLQLITGKVNCLNWSAW